VRACASSVMRVGCVNSVPPRQRRPFCGKLCSARLAIIGEVLEQALGLRPRVSAVDRRRGDSPTWRLTGGLFWLENRRVSESSAGAGVPGRSREQRLRALEQANEVRTARAALKKELASGKLELVQILADPPRV
jgi:hypothetical protein